MKYLLNLLTQEEKEKILEMYTKQKSTINEQGVFSGAKAAAKSLGSRIKTGAQDLGYSMTGQKSAMKNPKLEGDITKFKSRCSDTSSALNTAAQALLDIYNQSNNIYGIDYSNEAKDFKTKLKTTMDSINQSMQVCNQMQQYVAPYNQGGQNKQSAPQPQSQPQPTQQTQQPTQGTNPRPTVSGNRIPQTGGTPIQVKQ